MPVSPMLIALIGPDRYTVGVALHNYLDKYAPPSDGFGDLNVSRVDGSRVGPEELARAVQAYGFFGDTRVVVVEGLLSRVGGGKQANATDGEDESAAQKGRGRAEPGLTEAFTHVLSAVPASTVLIMVERGAVAKSNPLLKAAARYGRVEEYIPPRGASLERWISERAAQNGVRMTRGAISSLGAALTDLATLSNELEKLALYVGPGGTIDEQTLRDMSFAAKQDDVFELTSAVARRDTRTALQQLQRLLDGGTAPEGILPVLAWQVRTLLQVRDMLDRRVPEGYMAEQAGLSDFVVRKSVGQARQFSADKLLEIHHKLLELDHAVKTGRADADLSIDALVVEMCQD